MGMKLIEEIRRLSGKKNYSISRALRELGVDISIAGLDNYSKASARGMRLDVLAGLRQLSGLSWAEFGKLIDSEFLRSDVQKRK